MNPIISTNLEAIRTLCRDYGVARLDVFGSATRGDFDPERSDVDVVIDYAPETDLGPWWSRHFELRERLQAFLGRDVDLVMAGGLKNPYLIRSVNESRQTVYAA